MKPVKVYTTSWCPYCVQAKRLLTERKIPFEEIDCENDDASATTAAPAITRATR